MAETLPASRASGGSALPRLAVSDGTLEGLKWLGLVLMTLDHVNKYLLHDRLTALFDAGRLAMPIFSFVLAYNLARPGSLAHGAYGRAGRRLAIAGVLASIPFLGLGGLLWEWWPLNILFTLLVSTGVLRLVDAGGVWRVLLAAVLFVVGGLMVEFWWPAIAMTVAVWHYVRRPGWAALLVWIGATAALYMINRNAWALAALPMIFMATRIDLAIPRLRHVFYVYYPLHLWVIWLLLRLWISRA